MRTSPNPCSISKARAGANGACATPNWSTITSNFGALGEGVRHEGGAIAVIVVATTGTCAAAAAAARTPEEDDNDDDDDDDDDADESSPITL